MSSLFDLPFNSTMQDLLGRKLTSPNANENKPPRSLPRKKIKNYPSTLWRRSPKGTGTGTGTGGTKGCPPLLKNRAVVCAWAGWLACVFLPSSTSFFPLHFREHCPFDFPHPHPSPLIPHPNLNRLSEHSPKSERGSEACPCWRPQFRAARDDGDSAKHHPDVLA